jgi:salicylate hydroxylase
VAGCGPAGLAAALLLVRDGHRVTIFERFDAPAPIGSGLMIQPTGLAVLRVLGLDRALIARSARIDRLFGEANGRVVLDVAYATLGTAGLCGFGVHRATLFAVLHDAVAAAGIPLETGRAIAGSEGTSGDRRRLIFADGTRSAAFDLVVDALGTRTPLAPPCGRPLRYGALWASLDRVDDFAPDVLEQRYRRASTMAGVLPIGRPSGATGEQAAFFW